MEGLKAEWAVPNTILLDQEKETTFGRGNIATVMLHSPKFPGHLSRKHAAIRFNKTTATWEIRDLQSINGVLINGAKLNPETWKPLNVGDVVCFGVNTDQNELKYIFTIRERQQFYLRKVGYCDECTGPPTKKVRVSERSEEPPYLDKEICDASKFTSPSVATVAVSLNLPLNLVESKKIDKAGDESNQNDGIGAVLKQKDEASENARKTANASGEEASSLQVDLDKQALLKSIEALKQQLAAKEREDREAKKEMSLETGMLSSMEEEFTCCICQELFVRAHTLPCAHSFCEVCIKEWVKTKRECPICRKHLSSEPIYSLALDNAIAKMIDKMGSEQKAAREKLLASRSELVQSLCPKPSSPSPHPPTTAPLPTTHSLHSRGHREGASEGSRAAPITIDSDASDESDFSGTYDDDEEDYSDYEEGHPSAYYGGYGRCYTCGRRGHWSNGCPERWWW